MPAPTAFQRIVTSLVVLGLGNVVMFFSVKWLLRQMDPQRDSKDRAAVLGARLLARLNARHLILTEHENLIARDVIDPSEVHVTWADVGGAQDVVRVLQQAVLRPLTLGARAPTAPHTRSALLQPPQGVLLYGPPGCGKTMLAKALAKEGDCCFINLQPSTFMDKWYGESQKLIDAVFSLARKLSPSIIFIDEIDSFLRERSQHDSESAAVAKGQFLSLWDGFLSDTAAKVIVLGATNRPADLDAAIRRRMPRTVFVGLPNVNQREAIFRAILRHEQVASDVDCAQLAAGADGCSGSDIKELCRAAVVHALPFTDGDAVVDAAAQECRPVAAADFRAVFASRQAQQQALPDPCAATRAAIDDGPALHVELFD